MIRLTQRTTITSAMIDNLVCVLSDLTNMRLGYTHAYENQYQLYLEGSETGRIERTLGHNVTGNSSFYDTLYCAVDVIRAYQQQQQQQQQPQQHKQLLHQVSSDNADCSE